MEATVRRIMKLGRIVDAHIHSFPRWANLICIDEIVLRSGITALKGIAKRSGCDWEVFQPAESIAHAGVHNAAKLRDIIKNAATFEQAVETAKSWYVQSMHQFDSLECD